MAEIQVPRGEASLIMVIGVGGAGCNAVSNMWHAGVKGVTYLACNTDQKSLNINPVMNKVRLGAEGLGAGNRPERGRDAAIASLEDIRRYLMESGCRMVFIAAGMGGGTGTGAAPVIAKLSKELELLTVGIVTSPLVSEGKKRWKQAMAAIAELEENVDALLVIDNDNVVRAYDELPLHEAFSRADDVLSTATRGIAEIVTQESDLVGVDFADVAEVMRNCGRAHMSVTSAYGENRVDEVLKASLCSPLLGHLEIAGAKNILLNFSVPDSDELKTKEVKQVLDRIQHYANADRKNVGLSETNIIWGTSINPQMESGTLELVIIATGFEVPDPNPGIGGWDDSSRKGPDVSETVPEETEVPGEEQTKSGTAVDGETPQGVWGELSRRVSGWVGRVFEGEDTPLE